MTQLDNLFDALLSQDGSDLHISPGYPPMTRVSGDLLPLAGQPRLSAPEVEVILYEILSPQQLEDFEASRDLDFAYDFGDRARFRGNYMAKTAGIGGVFRKIPTEILTLEQLSLPEAVRGIADRLNGLVLVTGPTGSGKSTTLAAMIDHINKSREAHILTIEDPVEFVHRPRQCQITHREVGRDVPSFQQAIRSANRENPDVVLVGELRGAVTMRAALTMASSGVLVFGTVHTNSASATIDRFINAFPADEQPAVRTMLAECLSGIIAQQLLKKVGGGRVAVQEILIGNRAIQTSIRDGRTPMIASQIQAGIRQGMQTMDGALETVVRDGVVAPLAALDKALDKETFAKLGPVAEALKEAAQTGDG